LKKTITEKIRIEKSIQKKTSLLCGFVLANSDKISGLPKFDVKTTSSINQSIKDMDGKLGKLSIIHTPEEKSIERILLAGIGKKEDITKDTIRRISGKMAQKARELKLKEFSVIMPPSFVTESNSAITQIVEGAKMALYKFDKFKSEKADSIPDLTIITSKSNKILRSVKTAEIVADGAIFTKSIANLPPNECTPTTLANFAKTISKKGKMKCKIISEPELKKQGFGGISAVGKGSKNEPKLIVMEHNSGRKSEKPIVLVGKAVTFDTGGISLKPGASMDEKKIDK
jgi:leucyl aminopeptidase